MSTKPYLLISNDDGVQAKGINFLVDTLRDLADIIVVAPDSPRSGMGCAITPTIPITYKQLKDEPGLKVYSCSGTPVDCIKLGLNELVERQPDLVIGGINHGDNSSVNAHYSGTMGVATEGALQGYPSVAFSVCDHSADANFAPLHDYLIDFVFKAIAIGMPPFTCLNINFPKVESSKGCVSAVWRKAVGFMRPSAADTLMAQTIFGWWANVRNWSPMRRIPTVGR